MSNILDKLLVIFLGVLLPAKLYICIVGLVIIADTYYGVKASRFSKVKFDGFKFLDGIINKIKIYTPVVVGMYWLDIFVLSDIILTWIPIDLFATRLVTMIVLSKEFLSIDRHWGTLTGRRMSQRAGIVFKHLKTLRDKIREIT